MVPVGCGDRTGEPSAAWYVDVDVVVGMDLLPGMEVVWVEWDRSGCCREGCIWLWCVGVSVGMMRDGSMQYEVGWCDGGWVGGLWVG